MHPQLHRTSCPQNAAADAVTYMLQSHDPTEHALLQAAPGEAPAPGTLLAPDTAPGAAPALAPDGAPAAAPLLALAATPLGAPAAAPLGAPAAAPSGAPGASPLAAPAADVPSPDASAAAAATPTALTPTLAPAPAPQGASCAVRLCKTLRLNTADPWTCTPTALDDHQPSALERTQVLHACKGCRNQACFVAVLTAGTCSLQAMLSSGAALAAGAAVLALL